MDNKTFEVLCADARQALGRRRLLDALRAAGAMAGYAGEPSLTAALDETREAYAMLLHYMENGAEDAGRHRLFAQFLRRTAECVEGMWRACRLREADVPVARAWRVLTKLGTTEWTSCVAALEANARAVRQARDERNALFREKELRRLAVEHRTLYVRLFEAVWGSPAWRAAEQEAAEALLASPDATDFDKSVFLSAVTLGALEFFDARKISFLLSAASSEAVALRVRAQVGAVLAYVRHAESCGLCPELTAQFRLYADTPGARTAMLELQMQLLLTLETKKIERNLREDIFPAVMKRAKDLRGRSVEEMEQALGRAMETELNPEWERDGDMAGIEKKMRRLAEMQQNGADVFMASFRVLKKKFPFFAQAANWFCPFTPEHPDLPSVDLPQAVVRMFLGPGHLCHSDRYSFYLMLAELPAAQLGLMSGQLGAALEQSGIDAFAADGQPAGAGTSAPDAAVERRLYLQDLYRFFQLFGLDEPATDPFRHNLVLTDYAPFAEMLSDADSLRQLAGFAFKEANYGQAQAFYSQLPEAALTADTWQKSGYCLQMTGHTAEALAAYERANLLRPGSAWTLARLAYCYRQTDRPAEATACYEEIELMRPDDTRNLLRLGECYMRQGRHDEAFARFFKADYLSPDTPEVQRALAWYSLEAVRPEQAERYYLKLLVAEPSPADWLNAGHAAWALGRVDEAARRYREALRGDSDGAAALLAPDAALLARYGLGADDLSLMADVLER